MEEESVAALIFYIRGERVILDQHMAMLYGVQTKVLNQAVKRNMERFPGDFMFQLTNSEWDNLKSQFVTSSYGWGGRRKNPYAFTEQGVAMLSGVLKSSKAIQVNILVMRAFISMRQMLNQNKELKAKIEMLESKYDKQFAMVFDAIKKLIQPDTRQRNPIGFRMAKDS